MQQSTDPQGMDAEIDSIESLYMTLGVRDEEVKAKALLMLMLRSWLTDVSSFDPVSGHALHTGIVDFMDVVAKSMQDKALEGETKDRIYRIVSHTKEAVLVIMEHARDKILREHAMLPIHAAREVDSNSVQWLSRQPGRTLREKLSGKPYIMAVRRRSSVDTSENRLLKAFLFRLEQILIERQNALAATTEETCEGMLVSVQRWLRSEETSEIEAWENPPPNNTLLQDKCYRKVWDGWLWLQGIDVSITEDSTRIHRDILSVIYWETLSLLNYTGRFRTVQQPVGLDYDNFAIAPELPIKGYLFPENSDAELSGTIDKLVREGEFGSIEGHSFHASDFEAGLRFDELQIGDQLLFEVDESPEVKCVKQLRKGANIPKLIEMKLSSRQIDINVDEETVSAQIDTGSIILTQKVRGIKKKFQLKPTTLKELPKTILSLVTDHPFESSVPKNEQSGLMRMDSSVVDLCSIRPRFTNAVGSQELLPFRLLQQKWIVNNEDRILDCGSTNAIALCSDIETVSMRSLFLHDSTLSDAAKSSASMLFIKKLRDYIPADKLTYLVPDWGNDFDLECIRKSINFYFADPTPLPRSIAAIFAWQSSAYFKNQGINTNSEILVIDSFFGGFSVTPVTVVYHQKIEEALPQSFGITWERHPTFIIENKAILNVLSQNLEKMKCPSPQEVIQLFGLEGLANEAGKLTIENKDISQVFHLPSNFEDVWIVNEKPHKASNSEELKKYVQTLKGKKVFVLPLSNSVIIDPLLERDTNICRNKELNVSEGALVLSRWQKKIADTDIALWRDHLPKLSFKDIPQQITKKFFWWADFELVKDATVIPQRGRTVDIPVDEFFTLPAGQTHYSFPLQQGEGNKELQFVAYLKSPAFPLKEATACKLKMTYTYGADDPYELKFIPVDSEKAGFKSIRVEWRSALEGTTVDHANLPVPDFPVRKSWSDFQKFPKEDGASFSDLLEWVESDMAMIADLANFIEGNDSNRIYDDDRIDYWDWKEDKNGKLFCYIQYDFGDVFFHENNFEHFDPEAEEVSFDIEPQRNRNGYIARNVTIGRTISRRQIEHFKKSLRFPVLTIWNHGHSLSESDVPDHFRNRIFEGIQNILSIIESENMPDTLKKELFFFLSCLHKDAPDIVETRLLEAAQDGQLLKKNNKNIAFAIGNAEVPWQQKLLENIINPADNERLIRSITLEDLAIALWRSKELIFKLTESDLTKICNDLFRYIQFDVRKLASDIPEHRLQFHLDKGLAGSEAETRERSYQADNLCKHLELLLALLRSRGNEDEGFKMILAPEKELTKRYVTLVDDVSKIVIDNDIELKSRISLQIEKPEMFCNTSDLLYALRMYLTGDSGANTIIITGVSDED